MADRVNGILLDTSVVIAHLRGWIDVLALTRPAEALFLPLVAFGELYKGAEKSARPAHNRQLVDDFLQIAALLFPDRATAEIYAKAAVALEARGQVIPENDLWIAAVALECDLPLAPRETPISSEWMASRSFSGRSQVCPVANTTPPPWLRSWMELHFQEQIEGPLAGRLRQARHAVHLGDMEQVLEPMRLVHKEPVYPSPSKMSVLSLRWLAERVPAWL